jgi:phosphohistidine phosphatase
MLLLLCRHARAAERSPLAFPDDRLRPLVKKGRREQKRIARLLAGRGLVPAVILSSPWKRAWQTAGILGRETGAGKKLRVALPALATDPDLSAIGTAIGARERDEVVALVGHEPWMGELASLLLTGSATRLAVRFTKSGVMAIAAEGVVPSGGQLRFYLDR